MAHDDLMLKAQAACALAVGANLRREREYWERVESHWLNLAAQAKSNEE